MGRLIGSRLVAALPGVIGVIIVTFVLTRALLLFTGKLFNDKPNAWSKSAASECSKPLKPRLPRRAEPYARVRPLPVTHKRSPRHGRAMPRK